MTDEVRTPRRRNYYRADFGDVAIDAYFKKTKGNENDDFIEVMTDMLTDVLHAINQHGFDEPEDIIPEAVANFRRER